MARYDVIVKPGSKVEGVEMLGGGELEAGRRQGGAGDDEISVKGRTLGGERESVKQGRGELGVLVVRTRKRAHDGEANKAVVEMLAEYFRVGRTQVRIVRGERGRRKVVEVD